MRYEKGPRLMAPVSQKNEIKCLSDGSRYCVLLESLSIVAAELLVVLSGGEVSVLQVLEKRVNVTILVAKVIRKKSR